MHVYAKSYIHAGTVVLLDECMIRNVPFLVCAAEGDQLKLPVMTVLIRQNR